MTEEEIQEQKEFEAALEEEKNSKRQRKAKFELIPETDLMGNPNEAHTLMQEIRNQSHPDLSTARIALAWRNSLKPDKDGHLVLGKCQKVGDLAKELMPYDYIILLNKEVWTDREFTTDKKRALLDHELCHADKSVDVEGEPKIDDRGRQAWRIKKHDIEEFYAVVERHGLYKRDLEKFGEAILAKRKKESETSNG